MAKRRHTAKNNPDVKQKTYQEEDICEEVGQNSLTGQKPQDQKNNQKKNVPIITFSKKIEHS